MAQEQVYGVTIYFQWSTFNPYGKDRYTFTPTCKCSRELLTDMSCSLLYGMFQHREIKVTIWHNTVSCDHRSTSKPIKTAYIQLNSNWLNDWCIVSTVNFAAESPIQFHTLTPIWSQRLVWRPMFDSAKAVLFQNICSIIQRQMCSYSHRFDFTQHEIKARPRS